MSKRLLYLTAETWPTFRADVAVLFGKYLPVHGIYSDLITGSTPNVDQIPWGGGKADLCSGDGGQTARSLVTWWHGIKRLVQADRHRYQAIQVRDMPIAAIFGLLAARFKGLRFFYWMSFPIPESQIQRARERRLATGWGRVLAPWLRGMFGQFFLYQLVLPRADHLFVQSDRMLADMLARGLRRERMTAVPMGVDLAVIDREAIKPIEDPRLLGRRALVYLGTLDRPRKIELLFEMLALVRAVEPGAILVLAGDTGDMVHRKWLQEQAILAGVAQHVIWTGWLPSADALRWVCAAEIGLSPFPRGSLLDSASPTKVPEYLALQVPVVCNDNPDQEWVIRSSSGGRCTLYTPHNFADAVRELLCLTANARTEIGRKGREFIEKNRDYHLISTTMAEKYFEILSAD